MNAKRIVSHERGLCCAGARLVQGLPGIATQRHTAATSAPSSLAKRLQHVRIPKLPCIFELKTRISMRRRLVTRAKADGCTEVTYSLSIS